MEHIGEHLKAHAANDTDFRALIGEPRMGKVCVERTQYYHLSSTIVDVVTLTFWYCVGVFWAIHVLNIFVVHQFYIFKFLV